MKIVTVFTIFFSFLINQVAAMDKPEISAVYKVKSDIRALETAVNLFKEDTGRYPSNTEGLEILLNPPSDLKGISCVKDRYMMKLPKDPWGNSYIYKYPGDKNIGKFDISSTGADGAIGGTSYNTDFGNWPGSFSEMDEEIKRNEKLSGILSILLFGSSVGFLLGLPVYLFGIYKSHENISTIKVLLSGVHFWVLVYLVLVIPSIGIIFTMLV